MYLLYFLLWVIYNGKITLEITIFGIVIATLMFAFTCKFMDYSIKKELQNYKKIGKILRYVGSLLVEIIKANFATIRLIFSQKEEIAPLLVTFTSDVKTPVCKTLLANAITLTPGTITVTQRDNMYQVHCLDESMAEGLKDNCFESLVKDLE